MSVDPHRAGWRLHLVSVSIVILVTAGCSGSPTAGTSREGSERSSTTSTTTTTVASSASTTLVAPLTGKLIGLDPGHNGGPVPPGEVDIGNGITLPCDISGTATLNGLSEAELNLDVALQVKSILEAWGAQVLMTRVSNDGSGPCIDDRVGIANDAGVDVAVSIHADGVAQPDAHGFHVIVPEVYPGRSAELVGESARLGIAVRDAFEASTGIPRANYLGVDGIDARSDLANMNLANHPRVLVEMGVVNNTTGGITDLDRLGSAEGRATAARGLANGIATFLGSPVRA